MTTVPPPARLVPVAFSALSGWAADDHLAAFRAFRASAERLAERLPTTKALGPEAAALARAGEAARALGAHVSDVDARCFFEAHFQPHRVEPAEGSGFVTGYFEPEAAAALMPSPRFSVPIYGRPSDLVEVADGDDRSALPAGVTWARRCADGRLVAFADRGAIMDGALSGKAPVIAYVENWVEAFFIHVQGSARLALEDGSVLRLTFAGKSGHPYYPLARLMVEREKMRPEEATADVLRAWLLAMPAEELRAVLGRNRSFIFFRPAPVDDPRLGPIGAAGVALHPGRSLAVDRTLTTFHAPLFIEADLGAVAGPFRRLMIAQDTGSAIVGPARGDIFFGTGEPAWRIAARVRHQAVFTMLRPKR